MSVNLIDPDVYAKGMDEFIALRQKKLSWLNKEKTEPFLKDLSKTQLSNSKIKNQIKNHIELYYPEISGEEYSSFLKSCICKTKEYRKNYLKELIEEIKKTNKEILKKQKHLKNGY